MLPNFHRFLQSTEVVQALAHQIQAGKNVVPVAVTAAESVEKLRTWAAGRCLDASRPGVYTRGATEPTAPAGRRVSRPSSN